MGKQKAQIEKSWTLILPKTYIFLVEYSDPAKLSVCRTIERPMMGHQSMRSLPKLGWLVGPTLN